jgi:hypothetical protein
MTVLRLLLLLAWLVISLSHNIVLGDNDSNSSFHRRRRRRLWWAHISSPHHNITVWPPSIEIVSLQKRYEGALKA